jgi:hypothetical protein
VMADAPLTLSPSVCPVPLKADAETDFDLPQIIMTSTRRPLLNTSPTSIIPSSAHSGLRNGQTRWLGIILHMDLLTYGHCQNFNGGPQSSASEIVSFLNQTQSFMDAQDWVERYAWYGVLRDLGGINTNDAMMDSNGKITQLGKQYIGASGSAPTSGATGTIGLPGLPTNAGILGRSTSLGLIVLLVALLLL